MEKYYPDYEAALYNKYEDLSFLKITTPIYNVDKTILILSVEYFCGSLCGTGATYILKKENKKWEVISKLGVWIS